MGFFKDLSDVAKMSKTVASQDKRIDELEQRVASVTMELAEAQKRLQESISIIANLTQYQQAMALDMNQIYENIQDVAQALSGNAASEDEKYFSWRWNIDDDDDLPN